MRRLSQQMKLIKCHFRAQKNYTSTTLINQPIIQFHKNNINNSTMK